jgi:hypothetical protein
MHSQLHLLSLAIRHALSICFTNLCAAVRITADRTL